MDKLIIKGPAKLSGRVHVSKAKNAYLPIICAVLLNDKPVRLKNIPNLRDIRTIKKLLMNLGVKIKEYGEWTEFDSSELTSFEATYDLVKTMRASILVLGPLLGRFHKAKVSLPGGCAIGARPIDLHLKNLEKMGAKISLQDGYVAAFGKLSPGKIVLSFPSVGATENLLMAAVFATGKSTIENAALEPEIDDLANFLNAMGAKISGIGTSSLSIEGVTELKETEYEAIGDRIEAATYIMAGLITQSEIEVCGIKSLYLAAILKILEKMGAKLQVFENSVRIFPSKLAGIKIDTAPFPGLPTDVQAQIMALSLTAENITIISENIFENRFMHVPELQRMGAHIELQGRTAIINGGLSKHPLTSAPVMCTDLRASAALILAALACAGETEIQRVYHLDRGYDNIDEKLRSLGVNIQRVNDLS